MRLTYYKKKGLCMQSHKGCILNNSILDLINYIMDLSDKLTITKFIFNSKKANENYNCDDLKEELTKKNDDDTLMYHVNFKENDDLMMIYYDNLPRSVDGYDADKLENGLRCCVLEKASLRPLVTQFNKVIYNGEAIKYLENATWNNVVVEKCYEGTTIIVYNHNSEWYVSTRRCLNASESTWVKNKSYREMFDEAIADKFKLEDLDEKYCYYFILLHHKNKNIVNYNYLGDEYKEIIHVMTIEKYTIKEIDYTINDLILKSEMMNFKSLNDLLSSLKKLSDDNKLKKRITTEGFVIRVYSGEPNKTSFTILKIQTQIYQYLVKLKPNNSNVYQSFLELYQKDKLKEYLTYFSKYNNLIIKRTHFAMRNMALEILNLYHSTRKQKNKDIYDVLSEQYKKVLYGLHGLYINMRRNDFTQSDDKTIPQRSITIHDVYYYTKNLPPEQLRQLFRERIHLLGGKTNFINKKCIYTKVVSILMFPEEKNKNGEMKDMSESEEGSDEGLEKREMLSESSSSELEMIEDKKNSDELEILGKEVEKLVKVINEVEQHCQIIEQQCDVDKQSEPLTQSNIMQDKCS